MRNAAGVLIPIICILLLSGFKIPSPHELRKEFREELQKIKESTPGAKALARWKGLRAKARQAILDADINMAPRFASEEYEEAVYLLKRARRYALKKSYKKASYLAKKAIEIASNASKKAVKLREKKEKRLYTKLGRLKGMLDELHAKLPYDSEYSTKLARLYLKWSDIRHSIALGSYSDAESAIPRLEQSVREFVKQTGITVDTGKEKWEETI